MSSSFKIGSLADVVALERDTTIRSHGFAETTYDVLRQAAERWPERIAVTDLVDPDHPARHERCTYRELLAMVNATAWLFADLGVGREDRICYITGSSLDTMLAIWGGQLASIVSPVNPYLEASAIKDLLASIQPSIIVVDFAVPGLEIWNKVVQATAGLPRVHALLVANSPASLPAHGQLPVFDFRQQVTDRIGRGSFAATTPRAHDIATLFHTGGTTGIPKLVPHSHSGEALSSSLMASLLDWNERDAILMTLPLFHTNGVLLATLSAFACGAEVLIAGPTGFRSPSLVRQFWHIVSRFNITSFSAVPSIYAALLASDLPTSDQVRSLRFGISGGAPLSAELKKRAEQALGIKILEGYGLTEATLCVTLNPPFGEHRAGSVGIRAPYQDVRIVELGKDGAITKDCEPGECGELVVKSYSVMPGYRDAGSNLGVFTLEGYLRTGDLGYFDADGYIWLTGRAKDVIIRGGHNIDPSEIEDALAVHPDVLMVAAVGQIDNYAGEVPVAYLTLRPGSTAVPGDLQDFARSHIAERAAAPRRVYVLDKMPLTPVGKVDKRHLRRLAAESVVSDLLRSAASPASVEIFEDARGGLAAGIRGDLPEDLKSQLQLLPIRITHAGPSDLLEGAKGND